MKYGTIAFFVLGILGWSCDDADVSHSTELKGKWVETGTRTDTLSFEPFGDEEYMVLRRAELFRTGPYEYKILPKDSISLRWMLAATANLYNVYHFKHTGNKLTIGNFYDSPSGTVLTFRKLK